MTTTERLPGRATAAGTRARLDRGCHPARRSFDAGTEELALSSIGLGTYLGPADDATDALYHAAIARVLDEQGGFNVVDTASNYRHGRSERVIGRALREQVAAGHVRRDEVLIASKAGYVYVEEDGEGDGEKGLPFAEFVAERLVRPGIVRAEEIAGGVHCLAPRYLERCIERSRQRLGLDTIDVYYLHNPESHRAHTTRDEFLRRLRLAIETLERAVADGHIGCYGVATWQALRLAPDAPQHQSLAELLGLAREIAGERHHLRVVQLPYNLALTEAHRAATQSLSHPGGDRRVPLLDAARDLGVYVMASAPILQGQLAESLDDDLTRALDAATQSVNPSFRPGFTQPLTHAQRALQFARSTPGVGTALIGAKRVAHVEQAAQVEALAPLPPEAVAQLYADFGD